MNDNSISKEVVDAFNAAMGKEQTADVDGKIKAAVRASVFAIINSKYKNQIFWGLRGGPYRMSFYEAVTILSEFIDDPSLSKD